MSIGISGIRFERHHATALTALVEALLNEGHHVRIQAGFHAFLRDEVAFTLDTGVFQDVRDYPEMKLLLSIGGDGTLLDTLRVVRDSEVPVLGVNTGRLGFLSLFALDDPQALARYIMQGQFELDDRSAIEVIGGDVNIDSFPHALNEVTLHKKDTSSMISVHSWADGAFLNSYWADGLIVATPTGSTAYSLSCGGPIVMPGSENFILTPVAPHNLNVRPMVIPNSTELRLQAKGREPESLLTLDRRTYSIPSDASITLKKSPFNLRLVKAPEQHFFSTIRNKLMWGIDQRN